MTSPQGQLWPSEPGPRAHGAHAAVESLRFPLRLHGTGSGSSRRSPQFSGAKGLGRRPDQLCN